MAILTLVFQLCMMLLLFLPYLLTLGKEISVSNLSNKDAFAIIYKHPSGKDAPFITKVIQKSEQNFTMADIHDANPDQCVVCSVKVWDAASGRPSARLLVLHDRGEEKDYVEHLILEQEGLKASYANHSTQSDNWKGESELREWPARRVQSCGESFFRDLNVFLRSLVTVVPENLQHLQRLMWIFNRSNGRMNVTFHQSTSRSMERTAPRKLVIKNQSGEQLLLPNALNSAAACHLQFEARGRMMDIKVVMYAPFEPFVGAPRNLLIADDALYYNAFSSGSEFEAYKELEWFTVQEGQEFYPPLSLLYTDVAKALVNRISSSSTSSTPPSSSSSSTLQNIIHTEDVTTSSSSFSSSPRLLQPIIHKQPPNTFSPTSSLPALLHHCRQLLDHATSLDHDMQHILLEITHLQQQPKLTEEVRTTHHKLQQLDKRMEELEKTYMRMIEGEGERVQREQQEELMNDVKQLLKEIMLDFGKEQRGVLKQERDESLRIQKDLRYQQKVDRLLALLGQAASHPSPPNDQNP